MIGRPYKPQPRPVDALGVAVNVVIFFAFIAIAAVAIAGGITQ